jgi:hypothetical protein
MPLAALIIEVILSQKGSRDVISCLMQQQSAAILTVTEQVVSPMVSSET